MFVRVSGTVKYCGATPHWWASVGMRNDIAAESKPSRRTASVPAMTALHAMDRAAGISGDTESELSGRGFFSVIVVLRDGSRKEQGTTPVGHGGDKSRWG